MDGETYLNRYVEGLKSNLDGIPREKFSEIAEALAKARDKGKRVYVMGNGGSASTASHMACDLGKGAITPGKKRFKVVSLPDNTASLTAWANDTSYDNVFSEQLDNLLEEGDLVIAISGSGNSPNILKALELARKRKAKTIGLTGYDGGRMKQLCDICLIVPSDSMQKIEDAHLIVEHALSMYINERS